MLKLDVIYSIFQESYAGKTGITYRPLYSLILTFHHGRYKSFIDVVFNMRQATCLKDEVLKFQYYDDPYTLASPGAITNNFDDIDI